VTTRVRRTPEPGSVFGIPLGDGRIGIGRCLTTPLVEFFDLRLESAEDFEPERLADTAVLFRTWVDDRAPKVGGWIQLTPVSLSDRELAYEEPMYRHDIVSGAFYRYRYDRDDPSVWNSEPLTPEECAGLELAAVWDGGGIASRLRDALDRVPNKWLAHEEDVLRRPRN
jgi:hypothetical protein